MVISERRRARWRRAWDDAAPVYDRLLSRLERPLHRQSRQWVCSRARGRVLEVAIGSGGNLPYYPRTIRLTGLDASPAMLDLARTRAAALSRRVDLQVGDAEALPFGNRSFDTVVCTFSLCSIPDDAAAIAEMIRVLRPGGLLLLADHVASPRLIVRLAQWAIERASVPLIGEHLRRRPMPLVQAAGLRVEHAEKPAGGVELLAARRP